MLLEITALRGRHMPGEGHFIKSVAIRWELVHGDAYLRGIPALVGLGMEPLQLTSNVTFI